jgi:hypothetical protein
VDAEGVEAILIRREKKREKGKAPAPSEKTEGQTTSGEQPGAQSEPGKEPAPQKTPEGEKAKDTTAPAE